jgi:hypothetical protein
MKVAKQIGFICNRINYLKKHLFSPKNLLYTNIGISTILSGSGDILEQYHEILKVNYSWIMHIIIALFIFFVIFDNLTIFLHF